MLGSETWCLLFVAARRRLSRPVRSFALGRVLRMSRACAAARDGRRRRQRRRRWESALEYLPASADRYCAKVGNDQVVAPIFFAGPGGRTTSTFELGLHLFEHFGRLERHLAALLARRSPKNVDADFNKAHVAFDFFHVLGSRYPDSSKVEQTNLDEYSRGEANEVDGLAFVQRLYGASAQGLVEAQNLA